MAKQVTITEFKAQCGVILEDLQTNGEPVTITKRGRPMAIVSRPERRSRTNVLGSWAGRAKILGDIVNFSIWDAAREK